MNIKDIANDAYNNAVSKGFHHNADGTPKERVFSETVALLHSEISEALEEDRKGHAVDHIYFVKDKHGEMKPEGILVELADEIIRIGDFAGQKGVIDQLEHAIKIKMAYNKTRPPMHGKKY